MNFLGSERLNPTIDQKINDSLSETVDYTTRQTLINSLLQSEMNAVWVKI